MKYLILLLLVIGSILSQATAAEPPRLSERSLLQPGLWWNPQASGNGFDVHLSGRDVGLLWYTYRSDGSPTWYLASGRFDDSGFMQADLLQTAWSSEGLRTQKIGQISLTRRHAERADLAFEIGAERGVWSLQPLQVSAQRQEIDPSGAYYDPARSGFGLSIDQLGSVQSAVYYVYDGAGAPTWWLGVRQAQQGAITFEQFRRACARCLGQEATAFQSLPAELDTVRGAASLRIASAPGLAPEFAALSAPLQRFTRALEDRTADFRLARFDSAPMLKQYLDSTLLDPWNWNRWSAPDIDFSPAPPAAVPALSSTTNLIEAGVDEGDRVKSEGRSVFLLDEHTGKIRVAERPGSGPELELRGELDLELEQNRFWNQQQLFVTPERLVFIASEQGFVDFIGIDFCPPPPNLWMDSHTKVRIYDRSAPGLPQLIWNADIDGVLIDARRIGEQLYLVQRFTPFLEDFAYGASAEAGLAANRALLAETPLESMLPRLTQGEADTAWLDASGLFLPPGADQREQPDITVVGRINLLEPGDRQAIGVLNGVSAIHVNADALYLTTTRHAETRSPDGQLLPGALESTDVHRIDLSASELVPSASGSVDGYLSSDPLLQPFRMSEFDDVFRIVTFGEFGSRGRNLLSQLAPSDLLPGLLKTISTLPNAAQPEHIGKPGEFLYASRFVGPRLYASTFRLTDPLYVIDLADKQAPRISGQLEMPGFANYLHPIGDSLLLGVGHHADPVNGLQGGLKLSLFDVSDGGRPRILSERLIGERGTGTALNASHHAFSALQLSDDRLRFSLPVRVHGKILPPSEGNVDPDWQPYTEGGLRVFDVVGQGAAARIEDRGALIVARANDPAAIDESSHRARALLFPTGAAYFNGQQIWTARWEQLGTPSGPR